MKKLFLLFVFAVFIFFLGFLASALFSEDFQSKILQKSENKIMSWGQVSFKIPKGWKEKERRTFQGEQQIIFNNADGVNLLFVGMADVPFDQQSPESNFLENYLYKNLGKSNDRPPEEVYLGGELGIKDSVNTLQDFETGREMTSNDFYVLSPDREKVYAFRRTTTASDGASIRVGGWALEELISTVRFD